MFIRIQLLGRLLQDLGINMEKIFFINGEEIKVQNFSQKDGVVSFELNGKSYQYSRLDFRDQLLIEGNGHRFTAVIGTPKDGDQTVMAAGLEAKMSSGKRVKKQSIQGSLNSPMPGKIFKIVKNEGETVTKGETILILEAMKMEHSIRADKDGVVKKINYSVGELVQGGAILASVE